MYIYNITYHRHGKIKTHCDPSEEREIWAFKDYIPFYGLNVVQMGPHISPKVLYSTYGAQGT